MIWPARRLARGFVYVNPGHLRNCLALIPYRPTVRNSEAMDVERQVSVWRAT